MKRRRIDEVTDQIAQRDQPDPKPTAERLTLVPTGSTLLNLALSGRSRGGFAVGKVVNLIGDSSSGKTLIAFTCFAEMALRPEFDEYRFIYDDVEAASEFDLSALFGEKTAARIESPDFDEEDDNAPLVSDTIQDFHANIRRAIRGDKPFVYILDSLDALTSTEEQTKVGEQLDAMDAGEEAKGSYGMDKPKALAQILRMVARDLKGTKSLLIIISQTRDNINAMSFVPKTRSGGRALQFYSTHELWTAVREKLKSHDEQVGFTCRVKVTKNKLTGRHREVEFPIYYEYGVDDTSANIDFLVEQKVWAKGTKIKAAGLGLEGTRDKLVRLIEKKGVEKKLRKLVVQAWRDREKKLLLHRKAKYT